MSIPTILGYSMPTELPEPRVDWRPDADRAALLIHDMQNYFLRPFPVDQQPTLDLIDNIATLKARCDELGVPIFYTAQPGNQEPADRALLTDFWGPGLTDDPELTAITDAVRPGANHPVLTKWRYSAFQRTDLQARLAESGRDQLIVTGVYGHIGVLASCLEAYMRDIQPFLVADAIADFSRADHDQAVSWVARRCGVAISSGRLLDSLGTPTTGSFTVADIRSQVAAVLDAEPEEIEVDDNLIELGLDSIRVMSLVESWRSEGAQIAFADLAEEPTITGWHQRLSARVGAGR